MDFKKVAATIYSNVSTPIQFAGITAYSKNKEIEEYFEITRKIHEMTGKYFSEQFNEIKGIKATKPKGGFYFFADFNELKKDLKRKKIKTSNQLAESLLSHPFHIAVITGDSVMLKENNFSARIAFVDFNGKQVYENYKKQKPKTDLEKNKFIKQNMPKMINAVSSLKKWTEFIKK